MSIIVGREFEKKELEAAYSSKDAEFIAVFGRRRVGKTYLIRNFFQTKQCVYLQITGIYGGSLEIQLTRFAKELGDSFYNGASIKMPETWIDAFDELTKAMAQVSKNKKVILFFDELPWLSTRKSGVISALEYFWNRHWVNDTRVKLIVCGSAASWIIKKIIKDKGGLHNRVTSKIHLMPFNLKETYAYLKYIEYPCDFEKTAKIYMVMGGVPFYLKQINANESIDQNIDRLFFDPNGIFFEEYKEIFSSLFDNSSQYEELVTLISCYKDGVARSVIKLKNKLTGKGGRLTKRLEDLEYAGFVTSYAPYGHKKFGIYYKVSDEYCYFYLRWIQAIKNELKQNRITNYWRSIIGKPEYFNWLGYVFENICYKHISQLKKALNLEESSLASPWRYRPKKNIEASGAQIDLLFDRTDNAITICEIKYSDKPFVIDKQYAEKLKQRISIFKKITRTSKQIFLALISANGLKSTAHSKEVVNNLVTLNDLFKS